MSGLGVVGVMGVSVPATMAAVDTSARNSLFGNLYNIAKNAYNKAKGQVEGFEEGLKQEYEEKWNKAQEEIEQVPEEVVNEYKNGKDWIKGAASLVEKNAEDANYYGFTFGNIVKQALSHIPTIITDSTMELIDPDVTQEKNLLSVGKIMEMASSSKLESFITGVQSALNKHPDEMGNISYEDASGVIKIFKNLGYDSKSINDFFEGVSANSEKLEQSYKNSCTTKLLIDLLIGKDKVSQMTTYSENLKTMMESMKETITKIEGIDDNQFESFKKQLEQLKDMKDLGNPCPSSSGDNQA